MRVLFVHEVNWWTKVVYEIHELPELLSLRGHDVTLIDFPEAVSPRGFRRILDITSTRVTHARRAYEDSAIEVRTPGRVFPPPLDRLFASLTYIPLLKRTLREKRPDVIVLYGVPTNGWQTIRVARRAGIPVLFRAIDVSHALRKTVFARLIEIAERYIYRNANFISANNEALASYCISQGASAANIVVQYPGMDLKSLSPQRRDHDLATKLGIRSTDRVVMFMGTLYRFAGLDEFLRLIAPQLHQSPNLKVLLLGGGEYLDHLKSLSELLDIRDQVIFTGFIDYNDLGKYMLLADVAINSFPRTLVTNCALPSKVLQYLCCGIPTVATPVDGLVGLIPENHGVIYRELDQSFVDAVGQLLEGDDMRSEMSQKARALAEEKLDWSLNLTKFEQTLQNLAQSN